MSRIYVARHNFGPMGVAVSPDAVTMMACLSEYARDEGRLNWDDLMVTHLDADDEWVVLVPLPAPTTPFIRSSTGGERVSRGALGRIAREVRDLGIPTNHWM